MAARDGTLQERLTSAAEHILMAPLGGGAPETKEIVEAIGGPGNFKTTIARLSSAEIERIVGKILSTHHRLLEEQAK
jgi:hypothetical protein